MVASGREGVELWQHWQNMTRLRAGAGASSEAARAVNDRGKDGSGHYISRKIFISSNTYIALSSCLFTLKVVKQTQTKDTKSSTNLRICIETDVMMDAFTYVPVLCFYINQNHE